MAKRKSATEIYKDSVRRLFAAGKAAGKFKSKQDFAKKANVDQKTLNNILDNKAKTPNPTLETVEKIAKGFGASPAALLVPGISADPDIHSEHPINSISEPAQVLLSAFEQANQRVRAEMLGDISYVLDMEGLIEDRDMMRKYISSLMG